MSDLRINDFAKEVHQNAVLHGWWDGNERSFGEIIALCHSELSEALEEYRNSKPKLYFSGEGCESAVPTEVSYKPEGIAVEMIDCLIRILDWCGKEGIDVEQILRIKHEYNKKRPFKHGGKTI